MKLRRFMFVVLMMAGLPIGIAHALITSVSVTPPATTATVGQPSQLLLTWSVSSTLNAQVRSSQGRFSSPDGSVVLGMVGTMLTGNVPPVIGVPRPASVPEALTIPAVVLQAAVNQGMGTILYTREFTDDDQGADFPGIGSVSIQVIAAALGAASAAPARFAVTLQAGAHLATTWNVSGNVPGLAVRSVSGAFMLSPNGPVLQTVALPLSGTVTGGSARMSENIVVPPALINQVLAAQQGRFYFVRHFEPVNGTGSGVDGWVEIQVGGASSGPLAVARLSLRFNDGALRRVVGRDSPLRAEAEIQYSGGGLLQAVWEIATPPGTLGTAIYRPLMFERRYLVAGGSAILRSPPLPVDVEGRHVVRLRLQSPAMDEGPVALEYTVNPTLGRSTDALRPLSLRSPESGAALDGATRFGWEPVAGARAYQLGFYAMGPRADGHPPQAGMLVSASTTQLSLSLLARAHLESGRRYQWNVLAIGDEGRVLAESSLRELVVP